jgi:hypothetical protein
MIYILVTQERMPFWYQGLCNQIYHELYIKDNTNVDIGTKLSEVRILDSSDYLFVTSYKDLPRVQTNATVLYFHPGSGASPYFEFIDKKQEMKDLSSVDIHLFPLPTMEKIVKEYYKLKNTKTIGWPLDLHKYEKYKLVPKKKKIVVAGHITPGKQFYLATYLLKDLIPEYEVWFIVIEQNTTFNAGVDDRWSEYYKIDAFKDMGFKFDYNLPQEKFYEFISDASHVFTCSLADTVGLPIVEGALCGCDPIVPSIYNYWGQFMDYIDFGYAPFCKDYGDESVEYHINYRQHTLDKYWFDSKLVINRLLEELSR